MNNSFAEAKAAVARHIAAIKRVMVRNVTTTERDATIRNSERTLANDLAAVTARRILSSIAPPAEGLRLEPMDNRPYSNGEHVVIDTRRIDVWHNRK